MSDSPDTPQPEQDPALTPVENLSGDSAQNPSSKAKASPEKKVEPSENLSGDSSQDPSSKAKASPEKKVEPAKKPAAKKKTADEGGGPAPTSRLQIFVVLLILGLCFSQVYLIFFTMPPATGKKVINRNALLPHPYAGVCMNCHTITETPPVRMNAGNMSKFRLNKLDQQLLIAGQQVKYPDYYDKLSSPPLSRESPLLHHYIGVCSNCHAILNSPPSYQYMFSSQAKARKEFTRKDIALNKNEVVHGMTPGNHYHSFQRILWGALSSILFAISMVYVVMRYLISWNRDYIKKFKLKFWLNVHVWASVAMLVATGIHWSHSGRGNNWLHLCALLFVWLSVAGVILRKNLLKGQHRKNIRLLHTQKLLFVLLLICLVIGHIPAV